MNTQTLLIEIITTLELVLCAQARPDVRLIVLHDRLCRELHAFDRAADVGRAA